MPFHQAIINEQQCVIFHCDSFVTFIDLNVHIQHWVAAKLKSMCLNDRSIINKKNELNIMVDQEKAFDRVVRAELWKCLTERSIFGEILRAVQSLYICSQAAVRTREGETDWFEVKCGFRQGCVLSPLLFIIFMDNIMKRANQEENSIEELMFADDLALIAEDQIRLQEMVSNLDQQCKNYGMRISRDKTEVMVTSREPIQCDIELDGETHKQVEQFKYLGSIFVREGGCKEDVKTRCLKAAQVFYQLSPILGHKEIDQHDHQDTDHKGGIHPNSTLPE